MAKHGISLNVEFVPYTTVTRTLCKGCEIYLYSSLSVDDNINSELFIILLKCSCTISDVKKTVLPFVMDGNFEWR